MIHDTALDDLFERLLPSAAQEEVEGARWAVLDRVRSHAEASRRSVEGTVALNRGEYHILMALENGERHAYSILCDVEEITEGATRFGPGTLYTSISRLLMAGWIEETEKRQDPRINNEPRQYYRLTATGRTVLALESERLAAPLFQWRRQQVMRSL